jgi:hypothetical protein
MLRELGAEVVSVSQVGGTQARQSDLSRVWPRGGPRTCTSRRARAGPLTHRPQDTPASCG